MKNKKRFDQYTPNPREQHELKKLKIIKFNKQELKIQIPSFPHPLNQKKKTFFESTFEYCIVLIKKDLKTKKTKNKICRWLARIQVRPKKGQCL